MFDFYKNDPESSQIVPGIVFSAQNIFVSPKRELLPMSVSIFQKFQESASHPHRRFEPVHSSCITSRNNEAQTSMVAGADQSDSSKRPIRNFPWAGSVGNIPARGKVPRSMVNLALGVCGSQHWVIRRWVDREEVAEHVRVGFMPTYPLGDSIYAFQPALVGGMKHATTGA